jgi:hypothetical protein
VLAVAHGSSPILNRTQRKPQYRPANFSNALSARIWSIFGSGRNSTMMRGAAGGPIFTGMCGNVCNPTRQRLDELGSIMRSVRPLPDLTGDFRPGPLAEVGAAAQDGVYVVNSDFEHLSDSARRDDAAVEMPA